MINSNDISNDLVGLTFESLREQLDEGIHVSRIREQRVRKQTLENDHTRIILILKMIFSCWVLFIVTLFLLGTGWLLVHISSGEFKLEGYVIATLLTTTTITVIGLPLAIIKSLFHYPLKIS